VKHWRSAIAFGIAVGLVMLAIALGFGLRHKNACEERGGHIGQDNLCITPDGRVM